MSAEAVTFAKRTPLGEAEGFSARLLFYVIADNLSSETGTCVIGKAELASQMHASPSTIWRQALALEAAGFIRVIKRSNGRQRLTDEIELVGFKEWWDNELVITRRSADKAVDNKTKPTPTSQIAMLQNAEKAANISNCNVAKCEVARETAQHLKLQNCTDAKYIKESLTKKELIGSNSTDRLVVYPPLDPPDPSEAKSKAKRGTRLAENWELKKSWGDWVLTTFPAATAESVRMEALKFANYYQALTGPKATKLDWQKTWQNWCISAFSRVAIRGSPLVPQRETPSAMKSREGKEIYDKLLRKLAEPNV